jgi:hypothetical protein
MAITKVNKGSDRITLVLNGGVIAQVLSEIRVIVQENGADSTVGFMQVTDLWPQLTPAQQTNLQAVATRLSTLASSMDVPMPLQPLPGHGPIS